MADIIVRTLFLLSKVNQNHFVWKAPKHLPMKNQNSGLSVQSMIKKELRSFLIGIKFNLVLAIWARLLVQERVS